MLLRKSFDPSINYCILSYEISKGNVGYTLINPLLFIYTI